MKKIFKADLPGSGEEITYIIRKHKKSKVIRLALSNDGHISVTIPSWTSFSLGERFLKEKIGWLEKRLKEKQKIGIIPKRSETDYNRVKYRALKLVKERLKYFNQFYGFGYKKISIRNPRTRWGSCSSKGNLNYSYRLIFLPENYRDYIIVHELCHLKEFNHSKNFWGLVEKIIPDYKKIVKELKNI